MKELVITQNGEDTLYYSRTFTVVVPDDCDVEELDTHDLEQIADEKEVDWLLVDSDGIYATDHEVMTDQAADLL